MHPTLNDVEAEQARRSLRYFHRWAWPQHNPEPYTSGFHLDAMAECLEAVSRGELSRLLINVPPRHSKSTLTSVSWPAWRWINAPQARWLYASYSDGVPERDSVTCRSLIESAAYQLNRSGFHAGCLV